MLRVRGKDVQDATTHCDLAAALDQVQALIPELDEPTHQCRELTLVADAQANGLNVAEPSRDGLNDGAH